MFLYRRLNVSKPRYFLPGYRWTSNTPSSTASISSSAMTGNRKSVSQSEENLKTSVEMLFLWARIAACLHCSFVFDPECPRQRQIRRHNSYNRTAASTNDWPHVVTTKGCYPLMLSFKCQWPIFVKEDTSTPLKVDAPSCSKCFCQNAFSQNSSWELHSAFWWIKTWLVVPACVAHFSSDCDILLI